MANEKEIIIDAILRTGVELDQLDINRIKKKLEALGEAVGQGATSSLASTASELNKLRDGFDKDLGYLQRVAKGAKQARSIDPAELRNLQLAFSRVVSYVDNLKKFTADLDREGKGLSKRAPLSDDDEGNKGKKGKKKAPAEDIRFFGDLAPVNTQIKKLSSIVSNLGGIIDEVSLTQRRAADDIAKQRSRERREESARLRREALERTQSLRKETSRAGFDKLREVQQAGPLALQSAQDAREAKKAAKAEAEFRRQFAEAAISEFGKDDKRTQRAASDAVASSRMVNAIDERIGQLVEIEKLDKKDEAKRRRLAKVERDLAINKDIRQRRLGSGARALQEIGGIDAPVTGFISAEKAAKAQKFLSGELADARTHLKALTDTFGEANPQVRKYADHVNKTAKFLHDLEDRTGKLKASEAGRNKESAKERARLDKWWDSLAGGKTPRTPMDEFHDGLAEGSAKRQAEAEKLSKEMQRQQVKDQAELDKHLKKMTEGPAARSPMDEFHDGLAKGSAKRQAEAEKLSKEMQLQQVKDQAVLDKHLKKMTEGPAVRTPMDEFHDGLAKGSAKRAAEAEKLSKEVQRQQVKDQAELNKHLRRMAEGPTPRTPMDEFHDGLAKGSAKRAAEAEKLSKEVQRQQVKDQAALDKHLQRMAEGPAVRSPLDEFYEGLAKGSAKRQTSREALDEQLEKTRRKRFLDRQSNQHQFSLFDAALNDPQSILTSKNAAEARRAGQRELSRMEATQKAMASAVDKTSDEYVQLEKDIERVAKTLSALSDRQRELTALGAVKEPVQRVRRSRIYADGRDIIRSRRHDGGLESLQGPERELAKNFATARRSELKKEFDASSRAFGENSDQARRAATAIREYDEVLRRLGVTIRDKTSLLGELGAMFRTFIKYALLYQALYSVIAAFRTLGSTVVNLQADLLEIQAVTGSTVDQMRHLSVVVQDVAKGSKFSLLELTKAAKVLAQAGIPIEKLNSSLAATANFAAATGSNLDVAADLLSTTRDVFNELSDDVISNQLAKAINVSKLTGDDLKTILSLGAQTAASYNVTSEQFLGAVATLRNAGLKASTVATGLRQGMLEIFTPDNQLVKALQVRYKELGETLGAEAVKARFFAFTRSRNPLVAALTELKRLGFGDEGQPVLSRAFDIRSTNAIKAMIANLEELSANEGRVTFGRAAAEGAKVTIDGLGASLTRLYSSISSFTYNRSEGLLGWLTEVANSAQNVLDRTERVARLRSANAGNTPDQIENSPFGTTEERHHLSIQQTRKDFSPANLGFQKDSDKRLSDADLKRRGTSQDAIVAEQDLRAEELENAAIAWDIRAAKLGEAMGTTASQIVAASEAAVRLKDMAAKTLGPAFAENDIALRTLLTSYTALTGSEREVFRKMPAHAELLSSIPAELQDQVLADMEQLRQTAEGTLGALKDDLSTQIVKAREAVIKMEREGRKPSSAEDFNSVALLEIFRFDERVQALLDNRTRLSIVEQQEAVERFSQAVSDAIRNSAGELPAERLAAQQVATLRDAAALLVREGDIASAIPKIRAKAAELRIKYNKATNENLNFLDTLAKALDEAAAGAGTGLRELLQRTAEDTRESAAGLSQERDRERKQRIAVGAGVNDALADPRLAQFAQKLPDSDPDKERIIGLLGTRIPDEDFADETSTAKLMVEFVKNWRTIAEDFQKLKEQLSARSRADIANEEAASRFEDRAAEAKNHNRFGDARAAIRGSTQNRLALVDREIADAENSQEIDPSRVDTAANKALIKRTLELRAKRNRLIEQEIKQISQLNQEELKLNNKRATDAAKAKEDRLETVLANVNIDTPKSFVDATIKEYDAVRDELLRLLEERVKLEGDQSEMSEEKLKEERARLLHFKDQNASLDLQIRLEGQLRDKINRQLQRALTTGDPTEDARLDRLGLKPGTRAARAAHEGNRANLLTKQIGSETRTLTASRQKFESNRVALDNFKDSGGSAADYNQKVADQEELRKQIEAGEDRLEAYNRELGEVKQNLVEIRSTFKSAVADGFDLDSVILGLEQSESSVENLAYKITHSLIDGIEGVGDAFADALLEGEDFFESLDKLFLDTGKTILRDVIKTYTTESITGLLKLASPNFRKEQQGPDALPNPLGGGLGEIASSAWNWLTGNKAQDPAAGATGAPASASPFDLGKTLLGGSGGEQGGFCCAMDPTPPALDFDPAEAPPGGVLLSATQPDNVLAEAAEGESKGFFSSLLDGFGGIWDTLKGGFGDALSAVAGLFTGGKGGGGGVFGMFGSLLFKNGGLIKAATGGVITGRGTGTSDSIPGFVRSKDGKLRPILTSNGESILNARATSFLGEEGVHALNGGNFVRANTAGMSRDIGALMGSVNTSARTSQKAAGQVVRNQNTTQVAVTPAQMRMRMGDWLEQHVLEELSRR